MKNAPRQSIPNSLDIQLGSFACYAMSLAVLILGFWRLLSVETTEIQFLLGSLLILNLSVMGVITGLVLPVSLRFQQLAQAEAQPVARTYYKKV